jgi:hypothetical protein
VTYVTATSQAEAVLSSEVVGTLREVRDVIGVRSASKESTLALTVRCEQCGGYAFLSRCVPDAFKRAGIEVWTYECVDCEHKTRRRVKPGDFVVRRRPVK